MSFKEEYSDYLEHYGVRGMRWGVRKTQTNLKKTPRKKNKQSDIYGKKLSSIQKKVLKNRLGGNLTDKLIQKKLKDYALRDPADFWTNIPGHFEEAGYTQAEAEKVLNKIISKAMISRK